MRGKGTDRRSKEVRKERESTSLPRKTSNRRKAQAWPRPRRKKRRFTTARPWFWGRIPSPLRRHLRNPSRSKAGKRKTNRWIRLLAPPFWKRRASVQYRRSKTANRQQQKRAREGSVPRIRRLCRQAPRRRSKRRQWNRRHRRRLHYPVRRRPDPTMK